MGIRFKSNTWRAPLRLIDSLLPQRHVPIGTGFSGRHPFRLVEAFARAGWLKGSSSAPPLPTVADAGRVVPPSPCIVRVLRSGSAGAGPRKDTRLVISGRIGDVCAELDRLAAQEQAAFTRTL